MDGNQKRVFSTFIFIYYKLYRLLQITDYIKYTTLVFYLVDRLWIMLKLLAKTYVTGARVWVKCGPGHFGKII